jgi:hypothetical protein
MRMFRLGIVPASCALLLISLAFARAHSANPSWGLPQIAGAINGKVCVTPGGARFTFRSDGRFAYDGLWQSGGSFVLDTGGVVVTFDSGLRRAFALSLRDGALYMEQTRLTCSESAS